MCSERATEIAAVEAVASAMAKAKEKAKSEADAVAQARAAERAEADAHAYRAQVEMNVALAEAKAVVEVAAEVLDAAEKVADSGDALEIAIENKAMENTKAKVGKDRCNHDLRLLFSFLDSDCTGMVTRPGHTKPIRRR